MIEVFYIYLMVLAIIYIYTIISFVHDYGKIKNVPKSEYGIALIFAALWPLWVMNLIDRHL